MPITNAIQLIPLTAGGGTVNLDVTSAISKYIIQGTSTLTSNWTIQPLGTAVAGMQYDFKYEADITLNSNTITIFGETMREALVNKTCEISCYYDGTDWEVNILPDVLEVGVIPVASLAVGDVQFHDIKTAHTTANGNNSPAFLPPYSSSNAIGNPHIYVRDLLNHNTLEITGSFILEGLDETATYFGSSHLFIQTDFLNVFHTNKLRGVGMIKTPTTGEWLPLLIEIGGVSSNNTANNRIYMSIPTSMIGTSVNATYEFTIDLKIPY